MNKQIAQALPRIPRALAHMALFAVANWGALKLKGIKGLSRTEMEIGRQIAQLRGLQAPSISKAIELLMDKDARARIYFRTTHFSAIAEALYRHPSLGKRYLREIKDWQENICWNSGYDYFDNIENLRQEFAPPGEDYKGLHYSRIVGLFPPNTSSILEAGCGTGSLLVNWAEQNQRGRAIGVDLSPRAINIAKTGRTLRNVPADRAVFVEGDIISLSDLQLGSQEQAFDAVFNCGVIEHFTLDLRTRIIEEMVKTTKPGGAVIIGVPNYYSPSEMVRFFSYGIRRKRIQPDNYLSLFMPFGYEIPHKISELRRMMEATGLTDFEFSGWSPLKHLVKGAPIWDNSGFCKATTWEGNRHYPKDSEALEVTAKYIENNWVKAFDEALNNSTTSRMLAAYFKGKSNHWFSTLFGNIFVVKGTKIH